MGAQPDVGRACLDECLIGRHRDECAQVRALVDPLEVELGSLDRTHLAPLEGVAEGDGGIEGSGRRREGVHGPIVRGPSRHCTMSSCP